MRLTWHCPAFIASRTTSWPAVKSIFQDLHDAGLVDYEQLRTAYYARTSNAQCAFEASRDVDVRDHVRAKIIEASDKAVALWADISTGAARSTSGNASTLTPGGSMVDAVGLQDAEISDVVSGSTPSLQNILCKVVDNQHLTQLGERLHSSGMDRDIKGCGSCGRWTWTIHGC